ncbi:MAG TPA: two-component regulator propeller domain-containing protein, partial [Candidatus Limnocylindria bacterium]|nr:two-component regulator propeller domain-containing protein [Candidatus Limnocylindria bacterium]
MISLRSWPRWMAWLAVCLPLWANAFPAQEYSVRRWNAEQGLRQNRVSALCQTPDGYMWFGSWFGLVRFDGVRTTVFDHASNHEIVNDTVVGMVVDPATGTLWIGTDGGVVRYKDYQFAEIGGDAETPIGTGAMWVTGADTLWCQSHDLRSSRPLVCLRHGVPTVYSFAEIGQGIVWIADKGLGEAEILSERGFFRLTYSRPNPTVTREDVRLPPGRIKKVVKDSKGRLWFGTDQGLFVSRSGLLDVRTPPERVGGSVIGENDIITLITPSHDGSMWFYVKNRGLFQWSEGQVYGLTGEASLANVQVEGLLEDRDNSLWVTTRTGVMQLRPKHVTVYSAADGLGH